MDPQASLVPEFLKGHFIEHLYQTSSVTKMNEWTRTSEICCTVNTNSCSRASQLNPTGYKKMLAYSYSICSYSVIKKFPTFHGTQTFIHRSPRLHPILCQLNVVHILTPYFVKIHFNCIMCFVTEINWCWLTTHLHIEPRSRMCGELIPRPLRAFIP